MELMFCCTSTVGNLATMGNLTTVLTMECMMTPHNILVALSIVSYCDLLCSLGEVRKPVGLHLVASASPRAERTSGNRTRLLEDIQSHLRLK